MSACVYVVIDEKDIVHSIVEASSSNHTSYRRSINKEQAILEYDHPHPEGLAGKKKYTHTEMMQFLSDNAVDWEEEV